MANYIMKLVELEERIISEFINFYRDTSETDPKNLDILLFKIKYQINQTRTDITSSQGINNTVKKEKGNQNNDRLVKSQTLTTLNELKEKIMSELNTFKLHDGADQIHLKNIDTISFKVRYQIDQVANDILCGRNIEYFQEFKDVGTRKANALIRLQTLANSITCHIIKLDNNL